MTSTDASSALADLVAETARHDISDAAMDAARLDLLDTLGCATAGRTALGVREVAALMEEEGGRPVSSVWGAGLALPPGNAAFVNSMSAHALEYDDLHPGVTHTGVSVIPAALAMAEAVGCGDLEELLAAIVVGTEVSDRIALSVLDGPGVTGWLLTPLAGYFGAAASAARLLGLNSGYTRNALGFAYVQASGNGQSTLDGAIAKRMQPAFAVRGGIFAAQLAQRGLTGPLDSLEGPRGFFRVYHRDRYDAAALRTGNHAGWMIEDATYKPYPCCGWTHAALECAVKVRSEGLRADQIVSAQVVVNSQAYQSTGTPLRRRYRPETPVDAQFSIPYTFAAAFVSGTVTLADFTAAALRREEVLRLASKVTVQPDDGLTGELSRDISPAWVVVEADDGRRVQASVEKPRGRSPRLGRSEVLAKFRDCCAYAIRSERYGREVARIALNGRGRDLSDLIDVMAEQAA